MNTVQAPIIYGTAWKESDTEAALASDYGVNLQRVYMIEKQMTEAWRELHLPPGWSEVTLVAPKSLIKKFKDRTRAARLELLEKTEQKISSESGKKRDEAS